MTISHSDHNKLRLVEKRCFYSLLVVSWHKACCGDVGTAVTLNRFYLRHNLTQVFKLLLLYCYTHLSDILNFALSHQVGFLPSHSFVIFSRYSPRLMLINLGSKINNPLIKYSSLNNCLGLRQMSCVSHNVFPPL